MADRPILFSAPMVRALLAGTKTQTRRILPGMSDENGREITRLMCRSCGVGEKEFKAGRCVCANSDFQWTPCELARHRVGDRLWVRESGQLLREAYDHDPRAGEDLWRDAGFYHSADGEIIEARSYDPPLRDWIGDCAKVSRPSIHMPRWASRLTLTVTDVRVHRLQDISEEDAIAEGLTVAPDQSYNPQTGEFVPGYFVDIDGVSIGGSITPQHCYSLLWGHINGAGSWAANPWIAAYSFTVERQNIDMEAPHV